jgi:GT2 family glycosyltransferase
MPVHPVTIVVPIYDDWSSLERCIESVLHHVDLGTYSLLLVNDCGPRADDIEANVLEAIAGEPSIAYHRNARNLGFVETCNRAVFELDASDNDVLLLTSAAAPKRPF